MRLVAVVILVVWAAYVGRVVWMACDPDNRSIERWREVRMALARVVDRRR